MVIVSPLQHPLLEKAALSLNDVADYPVFHWRIEICPLLERQVASLPEKPCDIQHVTSFEGTSKNIVFLLRLSRC